MRKANDGNFRTVTVSSYQRDYYDSGAYDACRPYVNRRVQILIGYVGAISGQKVLDVGCYQGDAMKYMRAIGADTHGIDISPNALQVARLSGLRVLQHDVTEGLPYETDSFDVVYCSEVIEHVMDTDFLIKEMQRVLKPGRALFVSTPNICCAKNRIRVLAGRYPWNLEYRLGGAGHVHLYNWAVLRDQLLSHGFENVQCVGVNLVPWKLCLRSTLMMHLNSTLSRQCPTLCLNIVALCRKHS